MKYNKSGFTLIEMLIAMSIFFIMVVMTYANYAYFQNIARVKLSLKEISQSISEARNMATS
jgi:prepilin-type N-terminal cleavage/methylation domain-containing protein